MSFAGLTGRTADLVWHSRFTVVNVLAIVAIVAVPSILAPRWSAIVVWYGAFGLLLALYRLLRRGSRKRERQGRMHQKTLRAMREGQRRLPGQGRVRFWSVCCAGCSVSGRSRSSRLGCSKRGRQDRCCSRSSPDVLSASRWRETRDFGANQLLNANSVWISHLTSASRQSSVEELDGPHCTRNEADDDARGEGW
jgi:hypothetical protein